MKSATFTAIILALFLSPASAHPRHHHHHYRHHYAQHRINPVVEGLGMGLAVMLERAEASKRDRDGTGWPNLVDVPPHGWPMQPYHNPVQRVVGRFVEGIEQVLPHPAGCPRTAFCGCAAAAYLGLHDRSLWLASEWFRFPPAAPGPGMAAVRRHHVFVITENLGNGNVMAYDANSGRHATRLHEVSLRGYTVVNPNGGGKWARL